VVLEEVGTGVVDDSGSVEMVGATRVDGVGIDVADESAVAAQPHSRTHIAMNPRRPDIAGQPVTRALRLAFVRGIGRAVTAAAVLAVTAVSGCQVSEGSRAADTLPPLGTPSNTRPPTTLTTTIGSTQPAATSTIALPAGACVFGPPPPTPEVTFEVGTRLYTVNPATAASSCLSELTPDLVGPLRWSPAGDRVLLNSTTVFDGAQALFSGYFASNVRVSWSYPTGQALIAPAVADNHLLWRAAGHAETRTDISFLARTDVAAYHPAGKNIFAAGQDGNGTSGLFVAGNRGQNPRLVSKLESDAARVTEIAPDPSGARVYVVHDHATGVFHIHAIDLANNNATADVVQANEPLARLTVNGIPDAAIAYRVGDCAGNTRTQVAQAGVIIDEPASFTAMSTEPVGWVDAQNLVLSVRAGGCAGNSDLWLWNVGTSAASPLISGVEFAGIRSVFSGYGELPGDTSGTTGE